MGLPELLERVRAATGPDRELDVRLQAHFDGRVVRESEGMLLAKSTKPPYDECLIGRVDPGVRSRNFTIAGSCPAFTASIDAAVALVERVLPGWWVSVALCSLSGDSSMAPDYNGPDRARLLAEFPENLWHEGFHADLRPGDGWHRACYAVLDCLLSALIAREEAAAGEARCRGPAQP